uniref:PAZ domain-containing protein n=1 Tax=Panagrolaimus superbus TaxID=310955 RepID=A0A914YCA8_9BILA
MVEKIKALKIYLKFLQRGHVLANNRRACVTKLFHNLLLHDVAFFETNKYKRGSYEHVHVYAYDRSSIFFCSLNMPLRDERNPIEIDITNMTAADFGRLRKPKRVFATLKQGKYLNPREPFSEELMSSFLEVLFNQHQHDGYNQYVKFGSKIYNLSTKHEIDNGCELKDGHQKSVRVFKDSAEIQIDARISPFHKAISLYDYIKARWGYGESLTGPNFCSEPVNSQLQALKGLFVRTIHKENVEIFRIHAITNVGADQIMFDTREGGKISVADYFVQIYGQISFPKYPCAIKRLAQN